MNDQIPKILYRVTSTGIEKLVYLRARYEQFEYGDERNNGYQLNADFQVRSFNADAVLLGNKYRLQLERIYLTSIDAENAYLNLDLPMVNPANLYLKNLSEHQLEALRLDFNALSNEHLEKLFLDALYICNCFPIEMAMEFGGQSNAYVNANIRLKNALMPTYTAIWRECEARGIYLHDFYGEVGQKYERVECTVELEYSRDSERDESLDFRLKTVEGNALLSERFPKWNTKPRPFNNGWYSVGDRVLVNFTVKDHEAAIINKTPYYRTMVETPARVTHVGIHEMCYKEDKV